MPRGSTVKHPTPTGFAVERAMITRRHRLAFHAGNCLGCEICPAVCPQQAICRVPGVVDGGRLAARPAIDVDEARCSFCGECVALCPAGAVTLEVDGRARLPVLEMEVFPRLTQEIAVDLSACRPECDLACQAACPRQAIEVQAARDGGGRVEAILAVRVNRERCTYCTACALACPERAIAVSKAWRGRIRLAHERCAAGCQACADLCPNQALRLREGRLELDERLCTYCGACRLVCPAEGALSVLRSGVAHAPIRSGAWFEALEKLVSPAALAQELDAAAQPRRRQALAYLPGAAGRGTQSRRTTDRDG